MARLQQETVTVSSLVDLDAADLYILDMGLAYLKDNLRKDPNYMPMSEAQYSALHTLHDAVVEIKRGDV
jgi:hypothetical protein